MSEDIKYELLDLEQKNVSIDSLFIDPNNPRLMIFTGSDVPDERISEPAIQTQAISRTMEIGIADIAEKIKGVGFLNVDRVVVRSLPEKDKYVILEGNRRITAVKELLAQHKRGDITLSKPIIKSMNNIEVLVYNGSDRKISWFLQGLRHINGVKSWGPLEQARFLIDIQEQRNLSITEISEMVGLGRTEASRLIKSYKAWVQVKDYEEYGDKIDTQHFALFNEAIFSKPSLREWIEWDESEQTIKNVNNMKKILDWTIGSGDNNGNNRDPRVTRAIDLRDVVSKLVVDDKKSLLQEFENSEMTIDEVKIKLHDLDKKETKVDLVQQYNNLNLMLNSLKTLPISSILKDSEKTSDFKNLLSELIEHASTYIDLLSKKKGTK